MTKWYEVAYTVHERAYVEVNDNDTKIAAKDVVAGECIPIGEDFTIAYIETVSAEDAERFGKGTGRVFKLHESERED